MEQAIEQFKQYIKSRYPDSTTAKHYVHDLRQFSQLTAKSPREVTREDVDRFVEDQLGRGLAATTVNRRLASLHEFFEYLAEENQKEEWPNPVSWKRHRVKAGKPLPREASDGEVGRLSKQITHPRDKAMFRLMLDVGLRVEEVAQLRVNDLMMTGDGSPGRLRVRGKGNKERFVWLMPETQQVVQAWLDERPKVSQEAMFITRRKRGFSVRGIQERLAHYSRLASVKVSPHQLRHTFGRRMAEAEMPLTSLAALMGHAQVTTTQIYIAGAGVEIQADYQAAIGRLKAARPDDPPVWNNESDKSVDRAEIADVWALAGVEPQPNPAPQEMSAEALDLSGHWEGLPDWLTSLLHEYIVYRQRRWKPSQRRYHTRTRLGTLRRFWLWLLQQEQLDSLDKLKRAHVQRFVDGRLQAGISGGTVGGDLVDLWAFLRYWEERGHPVCPSVFRVKRPKRREALPRFLSELDFQRLEKQVLQSTQAGKREDLLNRAWFYLLSEAGLRLSEVRDLMLGDVDLIGQRLTVRQGKENRDRIVPLSPNLLTALKAYLPLRGEAQTDHLLIYRQQPLTRDLIRGRLRRYGQRAHVEVSPHRLRHTLATRLLNEGMPITSLRRLLGHERLDTTLIYARVYNKTVQRDYEHAYARLSPAPALADEFFSVPTEVTELHSATLEDDCV
jgi:integrase/recombinase XerC